MAGERSRFRAHAFHEAAVAADRVDVVVEDREAGLVVARREPLLRDGHAHARRDALPERAGRRLDARHQVILGMAGRLAADLAEALDVVERDRVVAEHFVLRVHRLDAGQMQHRPQQHRRVAVGQHEAVAVGPDRIGGIEAHHAVPQHVRQRRQRHRRAGVAGVGRLHGVDRQRADRVDAQRGDVLVARKRSVIVGACSRVGPRPRHRPSQRALAGDAAGGNRRSPARSAASAGTFSAPVTTNSTQRDAVEHRVGERHAPVALVRLRQRHVEEVFVRAPDRPAPATRCGRRGRGRGARGRAPAACRRTSRASARNAPRRRRGRSLRPASACTFAGGSATCASRLSRDVREVAVGVAGRRHALVDLEQVHVGPRHVLVRERAQHLPRRVAAADRELEAAALLRPPRAPARR